MKKLKKYFLIQGILTTLLNQAFADPMSTSASTDFYYTIGTGLLSEVEFGEYTLKSRTPWFAKYPIGLDNGGQNWLRNIPRSPLIIIGCGYKIFPRFKIEAIYFKPLIDQLCHNFTAKVEEKDKTIISTQEYGINILQLRSRIDLINIKNIFAFYVTGGIGGSLILMEDCIRALLNKNAADGVANDTYYQRLNTEIHPYAPLQPFYSLNWMIGSGISINLAEDINMDISCEYHCLANLPKYESEIIYQDKKPRYPSNYKEKILNSWAVVIKLVYDI